MSPRRRRILGSLLLVTAWALLVVSCGDSAVSKEEYGRELDDVMVELEDAWGDAGSAVAPSVDTASAPTAATIDDLRRSQLGLRDAANRLDAITPPADIEDDHDALVAGVRDMADAVDLLIEAQELAESDPERALELAREFATDESFGTVEAAASRIRSAGVDAGL